MHDARGESVINSRYTGYEVFPGSEMPLNNRQVLRAVPRDSPRGAEEESSSAKDQPRPRSLPSSSMSR